jgi:hypothetical protein
MRNDTAKISQQVDGSGEVSHLKTQVHYSPPPKVAPSSPSWKSRASGGKFKTQAALRRPNVPPADGRKGGEEAPQGIGNRVHRCKNRILRVPLMVQGISDME